MIVLVGYPLQMAPRWHPAHCSCLKEANLIVCLAIPCRWHPAHPSYQGRD